MVPPRNGLSRPLRQLFERERRRTKTLPRPAKIEELRHAKQRHHPPTQGRRGQRLAPILRRPGPRRAWSEGRDARNEGGALAPRARGAAQSSRAARSTAPAAEGRLSTACAKTRDSILKTPRIPGEATPPGVSRFRTTPWH